MSNQSQSGQTSVSPSCEVNRSASSKAVGVLDALALCVGSVVISVTVALGTVFLLWASGLPTLPAVSIMLGITAGSLVSVRRRRVIATATLCGLWAVAAFLLWRWSDQSYLPLQILQGCAYALGVSLLWSLGKSADQARQ
jgi:hypothetical protein